MQVIRVEEGRIKKIGRGARINQRPDRYGRVVGKEEMNKKREMAGLRIGEGYGDWEGAAQPDPYWLGCRFLAGWQVEGSGREGREEESRDQGKVLGEETEAGS